MSAQHVMHETRMRLARFYTNKSEDPSTKTGCVIYSADGNIVGRGYNRFPPNVEQTMDRLHDRPVKYLLTLHGEADALMSCGRRSSLVGSSLYTTIYPCTSCTKLIIVSGVSLVCYETRLEPRWTDDKWVRDLEWSERMFAESGVEVRRIVIDRE